MDDFLQSYAFYRNQSPAAQKITQAEIAKIVKEKISELEKPLEILPLNKEQNSSLVLFHSSSKKCFGKFYTIWP